MTRHFLDIGSNVGQTFDWVATQPHDYRDHLWSCFEPSPRQFSALLAKVEERASKGYRVRVCPFAVAGRNAIVPLFEKDDALGDSLHAWTESDHSPTNRPIGYMLMVATRSLSSVILELTSADDVVVLDIDAEGAEYEMLLNLAAAPDALRRVKRILCEFHHVKGRDCAQRKAELIAFYASKGLEIECRGFVP